MSRHPSVTLGWLRIESSHDGIPINLHEMIDFDGGRTRARTVDPLIKSQLLYQLSYTPIEILRDQRKASADMG